MGDLNISFCKDTTCDTTYTNIGQIIGTKVENGTTVPSSIYPYAGKTEYSNETPYIFKVENTGTLDSTVKIKLKEDASFAPSGEYSSYARLTSKYASHLKVAIKKRVLYKDNGYQLGDVNMDGIVNLGDSDYLTGSDALISGSTIVLTEIQKQLADINGDGKLNTADSTLICSMAAGLYDSIYSTKVYNYTTTDKIYLLTPREIYSNWSNQNDKTIKTSRQLDYYKGKGTTTTNTTSAIKSYMGTDTYYWLRSAYPGMGSSYFCYITSDGKDYGGDIISGVESLGISPVFRIG